MKVNEFSRRLGIPSTKVRYYDRIGLISGARDTDNNYREFNEMDALHIYNAQMLRSFDMSIQESADAEQNYGLNDLSSWLNGRIPALDQEIRYEEMRLLRLREMNDYICSINPTSPVVEMLIMVDSYNVWTFGTHIKSLDDTEEQASRMLAEKMPFSYAAVRISKESLLAGGKLDVDLGIGILASNLKKLDMVLPGQERFLNEGHPMMTQSVQIEDLSNMTASDLDPLLNAVHLKNLEISSDVIGRVYISYRKDGRLMQGIILGVQTRSI